MAGRPSKAGAEAARGSWHPRLSSPATPNLCVEREPPLLLVTQQTSRPKPMLCLGGLRKQKCVFLQKSKLKVFARLVPQKGCKRRPLSKLLAVFCRSLAFLGFCCIVPCCVYVQVSHFCKDTGYIGMGASLLQYGLILTDCTCKDYISRKGHILRY